MLMVVAAIVTIVAVGCGSSSGAASKVAVFPMADTPDANTHTQISFRGASPAQLTGIKVRGSRSGTHNGVLRAHSDGNGASFIPNKPFKAGETVSVKADVSLVGEHKGRVRFKIAEPAPIGVPGHVQGDPGGNPNGAQHFHSRPDLQPPKIKILKKTSKVAPGDLFLAPKAGPGQDGTEITDGNGKLIWYKRVPHLTSPLDFRVQQYEGKPVLTWWQGGVHHGQGQGHGIILDSSYRQIAHVDAGNGYKADFHEFQLSRENTAFFVIYEPVLADLTAVGGPKRGSVLDGIVQEVDVKTGLVLFEWHSLGNVRTTESYSTPPKNAPFDVVHLNSVDEEKNGNLLISERDLHAAVEIDRHTGKLLWRLGGKKSNFRMTGNSQFIGQHHIRRLNDGRLSVFDNGAPPYPGRPARGLVLSVKGHTVKVSRSFQRSSSLRSPSQGSVQQLPNGNFMVGWGGSNPFFTEFTSKGKIALDARIAVNDDSYRAFRFPWVGKPSAPPDIAAKTSGGKTRVWASWNGATEVAQWRVLVGPVSPAVMPNKTVPKKGFETSITLDSAQQHVALQALDKNGVVLGTSKTIAPS
jgi:arylsulfotransferase ASST